MAKKQYLSPLLQAFAFEGEDVITASNRVIEGNQHTIEGFNPGWLED